MTDNRPDLTADADKALAFHAELQAIGRSKVQKIIEFGDFMNALHEREFTAGKPRYREWTSWLESVGLVLRTMEDYRLIAREAKVSAKIAESSSRSEAYELAQTQRDERLAAEARAVAAAKQAEAEKAREKADHERTIAEAAEEERLAKEADAERARVEAEQADAAEREQREREAREKAEAADAAERQAEEARKAKDRAEAEEARKTREAEAAAKKAADNTVENVKKRVASAGKRAAEKIAETTAEQLEFWQAYAADKSEEAEAAKARVAALETDDPEHRDELVAELGKKVDAMTAQSTVWREKSEREKAARIEAEAEAARWKAQAVALETALGEITRGER